MKFSILRHNMSYYLTNLGDKSLEFIPVEKFTVIKCDNDTYVLPYGILQYAQLVKMNQAQPKDLMAMLLNVVTGAGVSKYDYKTSETIKHCNAQGKTGDFEVIGHVIANLLNDYPDYISMQDYHDLIQQAIKMGNLKISDHEMQQLKGYGKEYNHDLTSLVLPAFIELIKQLDQQGILSSFADPETMVQNSREG